MRSPPPARESHPGNKGFGPSACARKRPLPAMVQSPGWPAGRPPARAPRAKSAGAHVPPRRQVPDVSAHPRVAGQAARGAFAIDERLVHRNHSARISQRSEITIAQFLVDSVNQEPDRLICHLCGGRDAVSALADYAPVGVRFRSAPARFRGLVERAFCTSLRSRDLTKVKFDCAQRSLGSPYRQPLLSKLLETRTPECSMHVLVFAAKRLSATPRR